MSIQGEITRISNNVQNTIDTIGATGVTVPDGANSDDLPSLAQALANTKQDKLTGAEGQVVGFDESGNAVAQEAPSGLPTGGTPGQMLYHGENGPEWGDKPVMYVNVTIDSSSSTGFTADKTSEEIYQAFQNGYVVLAVLPEAENKVVPLNSAIEIEQGSYVLIFMSFTELRELIIQIINYSDNGDAVTVSFTKLGANGIAFTPGATGLTAKNVQDAIEEVNTKATRTAIPISIPTTGWTDNKQTFTATGIPSDPTTYEVHLSQVGATNVSAAIACGLYIADEAANSLTLAVSSVPEAAFQVYAVVQGVSA